MQTSGGSGVLLVPTKEDKEKKEKKGDQERGKR